jgi:hypothetical protein
MHKTTTTLEIDLDVFKTLHSHILYIDEPLNNVLRRILKLDRGNATLSAMPEKTLAIVKIGRGICATGIEIAGGGIKVFKGSTFSKKVAPKLSGSYLELRNKLVKEGILNSDFELTQDYTFNSKSAAATVVLGSQNNAGPWKR